MADYREELINKFYSSFQKLDYNGMTACYKDEIVFFDPVFGLLRGNEAKYMWEMLCKSAKDFSLTYQNIQHLDDEYSTCEWEATYTFSKTGRKVVNKVKANMRFVNGSIIEHSDAFSLHKWSVQALGFLGWLLGWNRFFQRRLQKNALKNLKRFMQSK